MASPDGKSWTLWRGLLNHPAPDYAIYRIFFGDVARLGDMAFHEAVRWEEGRDFAYEDLPIGGLSAPRIEMIRKAALECNRQLTDLMLQKIILSLEQAKRYPGEGFLLMPPPPGIMANKKKQTALLKATIAQLRLQLGAPSFATLDSFVRRLYRASPGRMVIVPPSDNAIHSRFLQYIARLEQLASENPVAARELARRAQELRAVGIDEQQWVAMKQVAADYSPDFIFIVEGLSAAAPRMRMPLHGPYTAGVLSSGQPVAGIANAGGSPPVQPVIPFRPYSPVGAAAQPALPPTGGGAGQQTPRTGNTSGPLSGLSPEESKKLGEKKMLSLTTHVAELRVRLGEATFRKFDDYLHRLYEAEGRETFVAIAAPDKSAKKP
jgi:hypothetical protein